MTTPNTLRGVVFDAMRQRGFTPDNAEKKINEFADAVLASSDHLSYRVLADAVGAVISETTGADAPVPGSKAELADLRRLTAWLPDMIRHQEAEKIRDAWIGTCVPGQWGVATKIAYKLDPFERNPAGQWIRKSDGAVVPWPVVTD